MPELPEVEITRRKLIEQKLIGVKISGFWSDWPRGLRIAKSAKLVNSDIASRKILGIRRIGKVLFFNLSKKANKGNKGTEVEKILGWHFRMSGRLEIQNSKINLRVPSLRSREIKNYPSTGSGWRAASSHNSKSKNSGIHNILKFDDGRELMFRDPRKFGIVWYGTPAELKKDPYIGTLGPDMLSVRFSEFKKQLKNKRGRIKPVLLDQKIVAGIGNIIVDESLWHARIHPLTSLYILSDSKIITIFKSLKLVINRILKVGGSTMRNWSHPDGETGGYERIRWVYGREGKKCPRCKSIIRRIVVGSRGTSICERCQK